MIHGLLNIAMRIQEQWMVKQNKTERGMQLKEYFLQIYLRHVSSKKNALVSLVQTNFSKYNSLTCRRNYMCFGLVMLDRIFFSSINRQGILHRGKQQHTSIYERKHKNRSTTDHQMDRCSGSWCELLKQQKGYR